MISKESRNGRKKFCSKCHKRPRRSGGRQRYCEVCHTAWNRRWRAGRVYVPRSAIPQGTVFSALGMKAQRRLNIGAHGVARPTIKEVAA